jgi:hypothetical protein
MACYFGEQLCIIGLHKEAAAAHGLAGGCSKPALCTGAGAFFPKWGSQPKGWQVGD